jgi:hypothetical protein
MSNKTEIVKENLRRSQAAIMAPLGLLLVETMAKNQGMVKADADTTHRLIKAVPSAFVAPEVSDDIVGYHSQKIDEAVAAGGLALSAGLASRTTPNPFELAAVGLGAQIGSCVADSLVAKEGLLTHSEQNQYDVGPSAVIGAFIMKFLLDNWQTSVSPRAKKTWAAGSGIFAAGMTFGASYLDKKNGTLDFTSHSVGLAAGALASAMKTRRRSINNSANK